MKVKVLGVLGCVLLLSPVCGQEHEAWLEVVRASVYTPEQKQALYEKSHGVEKLLRTPVEIRDAWSDDEFFQHYAKALHEDMDAFIAGDLTMAIGGGGYTEDDYKRESAFCKKVIDELLPKARAAYQAALKWHLCDLANHELSEKDFMHERFRMWLRNRLLNDLILLGQNEGNVWISIIEENPEQGSVVHHGRPSLIEEALAERADLCAAVACEEDGLASPNEFELAYYRRCIVAYIYGVKDKKKPCAHFYQGVAGSFTAMLRRGAETPRPEVVLRFEQAEMAWDAYIDSLNEVFRPVSNFTFNGSGVGMWAAQISKELRLAQQSYLCTLMRIANGGSYVCSESIDFTQYEMTEEAKDALNQLPG